MNLDKRYSIEDQIQPVLDNLEKFDSKDRAAAYKKRRQEIYRKEREAHKEYMSSFYKN